VHLVTAVFVEKPSDPTAAPTTADHPQLDLALEDCRGSIGGARLGFGCQSPDGSREWSGGSHERGATQKSAPTQSVTAAGIKQTFAAGEWWCGLHSISMTNKNLRFASPPAS
jgi:hypothetical protein